MWWCVLAFLPYLVLYLVIFSGNLKRKQPGKTDNGKGKRPDCEKKIRVTVVVVARNEENSLADLMEDLAVTSYPHDLLEILIVDDNSTDNTRAIAERVVSKYNFFRLLVNRGAGKKMGISLALKESSGELVITTDADCRAGPEWIGSVVRFYNREEPDLIIGPMTLGTKKGLAGYMEQLEFSGIQAVTSGSAGIGHPLMCNGANLCFRRDIVNDYDSIIRMDLASGDDMFLLQEARRLKKKIMWLDDTDSIITTSAPETTGDFLFQRARWAGKVTSLKDPFTIITGIITLFTSASLAAMTGIAVFIPMFWKILAISYIVKAVPDFLLASLIIFRRGSSFLLLYFIPLELIYPFYVMATMMVSLVKVRRW